MPMSADDFLSAAESAPNIHKEEELKTKSAEEFLGGAAKDEHNITKEQSVQDIFDNGVSGEQQPVSVPEDKEIQDMLNRDVTRDGSGVFNRDAVTASMSSIPEKSGFSGLLDSAWNFFKDTGESFRAGGSITRNTIRAALNPHQAVAMYDEEGKFLGVRQESDKERLARSKTDNEAFLKTRKISPPEEGSGADILGDALNDMADPVGFVTFGAATATRAASALVRTLKLFTAGSSFGATAETLEQKVKNGEITDGKSIITRGVVDGVAVPILDKVIRVAGNVIRKSGIDRANKVLDNLENEIISQREQGLRDPQAAFDKAVDKMGLTTNKVLSDQKKTGRKLDIRTVNRKEPHKKFITKAIDKIAETSIGRTIGYTGEVARDFLVPISTRIGAISKPIQSYVRRYDMNTQLRLIGMKDSLRDFLTLSSKLKPIFGSSSNGNFRAFKKALLEGDVANVSKVATKVNGMSRALDNARAELDLIGQELLEAGGIKTLVPNYFPRIVTDYRKLKKTLGDKQFTDLGKVLKDKAMKLGRDLDPIEATQEIQKVLMKGAPRNVGSNPGKGRTIDRIPDDILDIYADPDEAMKSYMNIMISKLERQKVFSTAAGARVGFNDDAAGTLSSIVAREKELGRIKFSDENELIELLHTRFMSGENLVPKGWQRTKNLFYAALLGNPVAATTQVADLAISGFLNGMTNTIEGLTGKLKPSDVGIAIDRVAEEMSTTLGTTGKILDFSLKWGGFRLIDRLGKKTFINAAHTKLTKMSRNTKGLQDIRDKYKQSFTEEELHTAMTNLQAGTVDDNVKFMLWNEISDAQPISMTEMPSKYLQMKGGRVFYMLKTFTIKQLDIMRRTGIDKIRNGQVTAGTAELLKYSAMLSAANMGTDSIKDWMRGRDVEWEDRVQVNIMKNFGVSPWIFDQIGEGRPAQAGLALILPPISIVDDVGTSMVKLGEDFNSIYGVDAQDVAKTKGAAHIPVVGKFVHDWFGGGIENFHKKQKTRLKQERREELEDE